MTNTSRTLNFLRDNGYHTAIVERFIQYAGKYGQRKDMFGFGDIVAIGKGRILAVQSCGQSFSEHINKIYETPETYNRLVDWLKADGLFLIIGWRKVKKRRGGVQMVWKPRIAMFSCNFNIENEQWELSHHTVDDDSPEI